MKKKIMSNLIIVTCIIAIFFIILILFSEKINKIGIIENLKQSIENNMNSDTNEITRVDVTYLEDGEMIEHEHIIKTMYDENKHWEECTICGEKTNESNHTFTSNWSLGTANDCNPKNVNKHICKCGYNYEDTLGRKAHVLKFENNAGGFFGHSICQNCRNYAENQHKCKTSNGTIINCSNLGKCSICNFVYNKVTAVHVSYWNDNIQGDILCSMCNAYMGRGYKNELNKESDNVYKLSTTVIVPNGAVYNGTQVGQYFGDNVTMTDHGVIRNGTTWNHEATINFNGYNEAKAIAFVKNAFILNEVKCQMIIRKEFSIDEEKPTISSIASKENNFLSEWSKNKPIIISGTENYCSTVKVQILDSDGNTIYEGKKEVNNQNYSISCIPEINIEINEEPKTFIAIVTDSVGNNTEQEFTIAKLDAIPPTPTSGTEILGDWAKSKDFTFTATDYGIGQVSIAFNDIKDMKLAKVDGQTYSREYTFTGDVYQQKQLSVMYKDGLGNTSIQKITIDKLDNTAPTITNAQLHNNKLTITANDEHELLGEGSGVVKYRYLASEEKITNTELTNENSLESTNSEITIQDIYKMKYIYIVAEDYVGNISEVYEFEILPLVLTSTVNLNTADGKGEIILDWSSYDVTDKYFVVYRKQDKQTDWETIVPLTQKLTGYTYTDKLGNDKAKPDTPNITITGDAANNNINITATSNDNGTNYKYYIEAYDNTGTLLSKSN